MRSHARRDLNPVQTPVDAPLTIFAQRGCMEHPFQRNVHVFRGSGRDRTDGSRRIGTNGVGSGHAGVDGAQLVNTGGRGFGYAGKDFADNFGVETFGLSAYLS